MSKPKLDTALSYAARGFYVVPVSADGVALAKATKDRTQIGIWWRRWPDAKIGCHLGKSKLTVVEINEAEAVRLTAGMLPPTITAGCGDMLRYFYRCNDWRGSNLERKLTSPSGKDVTLKVYGGDTVMVVPS